MLNSTKTKRILIASVVLMLILSVLGLVGCGPKTTEITYELSDDGKGYLVDVDGTYDAAELIVPAEHDGLPVVGIKEKAFRKSKALKSVVIEAGSEAFKIGESAFQKCTSLTSVTIYRSGNVEIADSAFSTCEGLSTFDIPSATKVHLGVYSFEYINRFTLSIGDADIQMNANAFFRTEKNYGHSLNLTNCTGELSGDFIDVTLVNCTFETVRGSANNLVLENTKLLQDEMFYYAKNAVFRGTVVYHNNYKETWLTKKGGIPETLVIESIGPNSEFSQISDNEYYPLAYNITVKSAVRSIPSGIFGNGLLSALGIGEQLTITYGGAGEVFASLPYDTLYNGNLLRGDYTLKSADGQSATITFIAPDGSTAATVETTIGATLDADAYSTLNTTLVPGEIVKGYYTDEDRTLAWHVGDTITENRTIYLTYVSRELLQKAQIESTNDGLLFIKRGDGTYEAEAKKSEGVTIQQIRASFRANEFASIDFYGNAEGTTPPPDTLTELGDYTVYAHVTSWDKTVTNVFVLKIAIKDVYEVKFISNGSLWSERSCTQGHTLGFPNDPTKTGHTFLGWSTDTTASGIIDKINYFPTESHTLTAVFRQDFYTLSIEGTSAEYQVAWGQSLTLPLAASRDHYLFKGYEYNGTLITSSVDENGCLISAYPYENGITVKAKYEPIRYTITLVGCETPQTIYYTVEDADFALPSASRDWYTFLGWYTEENGGGAQVSTIETSTPDNYTFYASFAPASYTVRFMDGETVVASMTFDYQNQTILPPAAPQKDGYTCAWESFSVRAESFEVQLVCTPIVYTITYLNTSGATNTNPTSYTVEDTIAFVTLAREHYRFVGWKNADGQILTGITPGTLGDITLTAEWEIAKYTVHLVLGDGSELTHKVEYNAAYNLDAANIPTAPDKLFVGWYNQDLSEQISGSITVTADVYIYAKWLDSVAISNAADFEKIRENPSGTFHLSADVDMRGELVTPIDHFSGVLDGMGHKMYNFTLKINATLSSFGLFKQNSGTIRSLTLDEVICSVTADGTEACIGILVGTNTGTVSDCHINSPSFTVKSTRHVGVGFQDGETIYPFHIGGLVGKNDATVIGCSASIVLTARFEPSTSAPGHWNWTHEMRPFIGGLVGTNNGSISASSADSTITCTGLGQETGNATRARNSFFVGGLVGANNQGFTVEKCFANTIITVSTDYRSDQTTEGKMYVGAFIGSNGGILKENYATGTIEAYAFTEGFVGGFAGKDTANGSISDCYTTATVSCTKGTNIGGFIGKLFGTVQNAYAIGDISVEAGANTAGFVGLIASGGVANKCFTTSNVRATQGVAAFFCASTSSGTGTIINCYYSASASVSQNGTALSKAEESGAKRDYFSNITNSLFLQQKMYFYPEYWIFTTGAPILRWEIRTDAPTIDGNDDYYCAGCAQQFLPSTGSTRASFYFDQAAGCDTNGFRYFGCTSCNKHFAIITESAIGHSYTDDSAGKDLCNNDVLITYTCTNRGCNHTYTEQHKATGHKHDHTSSCFGCGYSFVAPNCSADGSLSFVCDDCGQTITKTLPKEHVWEFASWESEPDCTHNGEAKLICTRCFENGVITQTTDYVVNSNLGHMDLTGDGICDRDGCEDVIYDVEGAIEISTPEQLIAIGKNAGSGSLSQVYLLKADIDLSGFAWEPIGTELNPFTGVLIGGGYTIKNVPLFASDVTLTYGGLFGYNSGIISDLKVEYANYTQLCQNRSITFGAIAAFNNGTINRCTVAGTISLSFLAKATVNEPGGAASATQNVTLGLVCGVNNGYIVGCTIGAAYTFTFENYAFMGEDIDHIEAGLLTSGNYKNMKVSTTQTVVAGAVCGINNKSITDSTITGQGTVNNYLALSQFLDGRWGFLSANSTISIGAIAGNQNLVGTQNNTQTSTVSYMNEPGTYAPVSGNDPGGTYYAMSCKTTIAIYS